MRRRLSRLEQQAGPLRDEITLPDGTRLTLASNERLQAFFALMDGREHRLLDVARRAETDEGFLGLLGAMQPGPGEEATLEE